MFDILFVRTFSIIGAMLLITAIAARKNKAYETKTELRGTFIGSFVVLIATFIFSDSFPLNLCLAGLFSGLIGRIMGPSIEALGIKYKLKKYAKSKGITLEAGQTLSEEQKIGFEESFNRDEYHENRQNIIFQTLFATALSVFATAGVVFLTSIDFSFMGSFLSIALFMLIIMGLLNAFFFRSEVFTLLKSYFGAIIFVFYLLYDFNRLEKLANNETRSAAINIALSIYLDIINLFMDLLKIISDASN